MKIQFSKRLNEELKSLMEYRTDSVQIDQGLTAKVSSNKTLLIEPLEPQIGETLSACGGFIQALQKDILVKMGMEISEQELARRLLLIRAIVQNTPVEAVANPIVTSILMAKMRFFRASDVADNPYYRDIKIEEVHNGRFVLFNHVMPKNLITLYDNSTVLDYGVVLPSICLIEEDIPYSALGEWEKTWMSVDPHEIYTMQDGIDKAHSKVVTLGCGMGYFAYMASLKENVESVTIVEREPEVIEIFQSHILPQMKTKDKIRIIQKDAFSFLSSLKDGDYNYCYADIWEGPGGYMDYLRVRGLCNRLKKTEDQYWLEPNMNAFLLQSFIHWLTNQMVKAQARWMQSGQPPQNKDALGLFPLWSALCRNETVTTPEQLRAMADIDQFSQRLCNKNLTKLLEDLKTK